jgi:hypothetical protein
MSHKLSQDEYDALTLVGKLAKGVKPSACITRNSKRLTGIKLLAHRRDGGFELTAEGRAALFSQQCIVCLRAIALDPASPLPEAVATFLAKKGYIALDPETTLRQISERGREVLADIDKHH